MEGIVVPGKAFQNLTPGLLGRTFHQGSLKPVLFFNGGNLAPQMNINQGFSYDISQHLLHRTGTALFTGVGGLTGEADSMTAQKTALFNQLHMDILL